MYIWPTVIYIDPLWEKRTGPECGEFLKTVLNKTSEALQNIISVRLALLDAIEWPVPRFKRVALRKQWNAEKEELKAYYTGCYGDEFDDEELMGIFLLNLARVNLIRFSRTTPYRDIPGPPVLHLGFIGSLYWFHLKNTEYLNGGGMASVNIPFAVINFAPDKDEGVHTATHEILHLFGAHHSKTGVMEPHSSETKLLDKDNQEFLKKSVKDFFTGKAPLPGQDRLFKQPPIHK